MFYVRQSQKKTSAMKVDLINKETLIANKENELRQEKINLQKAQEGWSIKESEIKLIEKIAKGSFGTVFKGQWAPLKTMHVAIKVLHPSHPNLGEDSGFIDTSIFDDTETLLLQRIRHPRLVLFFGAG